MRVLESDMEEIREISLVDSTGSMLNQSALFFRFFVCIFSRNGVRHDYVIWVIQILQIMQCTHNYWM